MMIKEKESGIGKPIRKQIAWFFGLMFLMWIMFSVTLDMEILAPKGDVIQSMVMLLLVTIDTAAVFVLTIVYLNKYKEKGLAVTALVFSSIFLLATLGWWIELIGMI